MITLEKPDKVLSSDQVWDHFFSWLEYKGITPYDHQEQAILELFADKHVILNTPTGSGKSLVALAVHYRALCQGRISYYTSPIKALANEKFLSLCEIFGAEQVGLVTGDASVNEFAPIICCTAEVVTNMALREGYRAAIDDLIMDEFHFYSDRDRGIAWQVPLLTLSQTKFCLMSATLGETEVFEKELEKRTGIEAVLVQSDHRPVPLDYSYSENPLEEQVIELVEAGKAPIYLVHFTQHSAASTSTSLASLNFLNKEERAKITDALVDVKFSSPYGKEVRRLLSNGIGVHHAGLLPKYRILIEKLAQKRLLKVICGTDTLGVGVNVPIRTVMLTQLCKYDGHKTRILTARDFKQISGRAGRRGFDTIGYVVCQAPAHEIENRRAIAKVAEKAARGKKVKSKPKKAAPEHGFIHWNEDTFQNLIIAPPEPLISAFKFRQSMLLSVLTREAEDGCAALQSIIHDCHESEQSKKKIRKHCIQLFRGLVEAKILAIIPLDQRTSMTKIAVNEDLPEDFTLNQSLSLWLIEVLPLLDQTQSSYALNLISCIEAILEDPQVILRSQMKNERNKVFQKMKNEGEAHNTIMEKLDEIDYPKPGKDFIYDSYNDFVGKNPVFKQNTIRPKSIVREMFENYLSFPDYIFTYKLERTEGVLLRHLSEVYKVIKQTIPSSYKTEDVLEAEEYLHEILESTDSSLVEEWQQLNDPTYDANKRELERIKERESIPISKRKVEFRKLLHHTVLNFLKYFRSEDWDQCLHCIQPSASNGVAWTIRDFEDTIDDFLGHHELYALDPEARNRKHHHVEDSQNSEKGTNLIVRQTLCDPDSELDYYASFVVDISASDRSNTLHLIFNGFCQYE